MDDEENVITVAIFGYMVPILTPMLELFRVYDITNAQVRFVETQYRILDNSNQWIFQRQPLSSSFSGDAKYEIFSGWLNSSRPYS
ncbi:hypothetical protein LIER_17468 [Lithospermum erythrorhizon]|uniref:Uncharacterized protein n=1 Tax=Lithospermum erythrorhizon TaxID=34254 RepID=A0AAV3QAE1_LITER